MTWFMLRSYGLGEVFANINELYLLLFPFKNVRVVKMTVVNKTMCHVMFLDYPKSYFYLRNIESYLGYQTMFEW